MRSQQEHIARQLRTQYVDGICDNPVTLKSSLRVTEGHWKRNRWVYLLLVELFDDEYYRDLEMWVRGHSRSSKMLPFESLDTVSYPSSMALSLAISEIFSVKKWPDPETWVWGRSKSLKMARFDRPCITFYEFAIVTIGLSRTVFELFDVE